MTKRSRWMAFSLVAVTVGLATAVPVSSALGADAAPKRDSIVWGVCPPAPEGAVVDPTQTCGTVKVPLDYRHPGGRAIEIAVSRISATDPAKRRGVLLLNPGGPGNEGINLPSDFGQLASAEVLQTYDRIGFDPRGVGHSTPVTCGLTAAEMVPTSQYPDATGSITKNVEFARSAADRCNARSGDLLPFITTANTARDLDRIRQALGESRLSYWGGSYGTYLGSVYASLFPQQTDRMVLDSAVDPTQVWYSEFRQQSAGMAERFPDAARYAAENSASIGFGSTVKQVTKKYLSLARRLDADPATVPGSPTVLTGNVFRYLTFSLLYQDAALPPLAQGWRAADDLSQGRASSDEVALLRLILERISPAASTSPGVPADNQLAAAYAVACDDVSWPKSVRVYAKNVAADRASYPLSAGFPANVWPCAFWKNAPIEKPVTVTGQGPRNILILQNERDPATPLASALGLRQALGKRAALVTVDAGGHGVYGMQGAGSCADQVANTFLTAGTLPSTDVYCPKA